MTEDNKQNQESQNNEQNQAQDEVKTEENNKSENQENQTLEIDKKISELEEKNKILNDKFLRLAAELQNNERRNKEELEKTRQYAISNFAGDLVLILENFYLASDNLPVEDIEKSSSVKHFADAMIMTKKELTKILEKYSIKRIFPLGEKFDHNLHEAISHVPALEGEEDGNIKQVVQAGYSIQDRLIRPALVVVTNKS